MEKQPRYIKEAERIINNFDGIHNISYHIQSMDAEDKSRLAEEVWRKTDRTQNVIDLFQQRTEQAFAMGDNSFIASIPGEGRPYKVKIYPTQLNALRRMGDRQEQYIAEICSDQSLNTNSDETISNDSSPDEF